MNGTDVADLMTWCERDPFPSVSNPRRRGVRVTTAAAAALGLSLGGRSVTGVTAHSSTNYPTAHTYQPATTCTTEAVTAPHSGVSSLPCGEPGDAGGSGVRAGPPLAA
jgi:hypothetical protein